MDAAGLAADADAVGVSGIVAETDGLIDGLIDALALALVGGALVGGGGADELETGARLEVVGTGADDETGAEVDGAGDDVPPAPLSVGVGNGSTGWPCSAASM